VVLAHCATDLTSSLTPLLSFMALIACFVAPRSKYARFFHWWVFDVLFRHRRRLRQSPPWYQLPLVPIAAAFAGAALRLCRLENFFAVIVVTLSVLLVSSFTTLAFLVRSTVLHHLRRNSRCRFGVKRVTPPDALIVAADMGDPTIILLWLRQGWHFRGEITRFTTALNDSEQAIENLSGCGAEEPRILFSPRKYFLVAQSYPEFVAYLTKQRKGNRVDARIRIYETDYSSSVKAVAVL